MPSNPDSVVLGSIILVGLLRDRATRLKGDVREKRRLLLSSGLPLTVEDRIIDLSEFAVVVLTVEALERDLKNPGSSDPSREEGAESVREWEESCVTHHISI